MEAGRSPRQRLLNGRRGRTLGALAGATMCLIVAVPATPSQGATALALPTWPENPNWQSLVPAPASDTVRAVSVARSHGSVTNANALAGQGTGTTTMTTTSTSQPATIVLDFGREVGGTPYVTVSASTSTSKNLRVSTSEALPFLNTNRTTTLATSVSSGASNVKVGSVAPFYVGSSITIDTGSAAETRTITAVGTASGSGTGITFTPALSASHASGRTVTGVGAYTNDNGSQVNLAVTGARTYTGSLRGGLRFMAIQLSTAGTVTLSAAGLSFKAYRATADRYQGHFISSDDQLNRMWYAGAYTAQMDMVPAGVASCFTVPVIFDGAKRDRAIWSGDLLITNPVAQLSLGTNSVPYVKGSINSILNLQASDGRLASAVGFRGCGAFNYAVTYSAYSAITAIQYYRYTNDTAFITGLRSRLEAATAYHGTRLNANGLVVTNDPDYWQTTQSGEVTEYGLAYYELLQNMTWLETRIGTAAKVTEYTNKATALKNAINARLWNASAGLYQHTNSRPNVFPLDANMNAIRLGVVPPDRVQSILSYFRSRWQAHGSQISQPAPSMADPYGHTIEPLNNTWEAMARFASGDAAGAVELMRRLWGIQVDPNSDYYTGTFWEFVNSNGLPSRGFDSLAHAWGAGPTQLLTEFVLGATAVDPGYATWQVRPQPTDLAWAQGRVPTATGALVVKWAQDTAGQFRLQVTGPASTSGQVWVPLASASSTTSVLTGSATFIQRSGAYDVYGVGAGTVEFGSEP